jgi:hypothetical protein
MGVTHFRFIKTEDNPAYICLEGQNSDLLFVDEMEPAVGSSSWLNRATGTRK